MKTLDPKTPPSLAILSLPTTLLLAALPHWYTIYLAQSNKVQGGWANENPRAFVARLNAKAAMGKKLSDLEEKILRGQSAQQNAFEWWAMWAVAVVREGKGSGEGLCERCLVLPCLPACLVSRSADVPALCQHPTDLSIYPPAHSTRSLVSWSRSPQARCTTWHCCTSLCASSTRSSTWRHRRASSASCGQLPSRWVPFSRRMYLGAS